MIYDFNLFDRWLLLANSEEFFCYDTEIKNLHIVNEPGLVGYIMPTRNHLYIEAPENEATLKQVVFQNGRAVCSDIFNVLELPDA